MSSFCANHRARVSPFPVAALCTPYHGQPLSVVPHRQEYPRLPVVFRAWYARGRRAGPGWLWFSYLLTTVSPPSRPAASDSIFVSVIVKAPVVQILSMVLGFGVIALDYPAPFLKNTAAHRSFPLRVVLLFLLTFLTILFYQVRCTFSLFRIAFPERTGGELKRGILLAFV